MIENNPTSEMMKHYQGYPLVYVQKITNEVICDKCAHEMAKNPKELKDLCSNFVFDIHYEGEPISCDSCGKETESAYGVPE